MLVGSRNPYELEVIARARHRYTLSARYSERLRNLLADAEWVELPGLGHVSMIDDPELVARTIAAFVGRMREPAVVGS